jgi:hypothetical protein
MKLVSEMDFLSDDALFEVEFETKVKACEEVIKTLPMYDREILDLYLKHGSLRNVTKETLIPKSSIHETIMRIRELIQQRLCA